MIGEIRIVFDGPPSHESGRFVEVENAWGQGIGIGQCHERDDGFWELRIGGVELGLSTEQRAAPETPAKRDRLAAENEILRAAISDNLPGLSAIDDGVWCEYAGDLVLKEDQWNSICAAIHELKIALAGGEAVLEQARKS